MCSSTPGGDETIYRGQSSPLEYFQLSRRSNLSNHQILCLRYQEDYFFFNSIQMNQLKKVITDSETSSFTVGIFHVLLQFLKLQKKKNRNCGFEIGIVKLTLCLLKSIHYSLQVKCTHTNKSV